MDDPDPSPAAPMSDDDLLRHVADELVAAVTAALGPWVRSAVARRAGDDADDDEGRRRVATDDAAARCVVDVGGAVAALVRLDIDAQASTPLAEIRRASRYPADVLEAIGVPLPARDPFDERANPDDRYDVGPLTWADLGPEVAAAGIAWGAAKAHAHLRRHRPPPRPP